MNLGYFHLAINHFPIVGTIIGSLLLLIGMFSKQQGIKISGLGTLVFAALMAIPAILTGDPAEESLKGISGVAMQLIDRHEDIAYVGLWTLLPLGLISALALYSLLKNEKTGKFLVIAAMILSLIASGVVIYVGRTGGMIRHTEFHQNGTQLPINSIDTEDKD